MSEQTKIEWAEHTGGPYLGCSPVSPGCANCYAWELAESRLEPIIRLAYRVARFEDWQTRPVWGDKATRVLSRGFWDDARRINRKHEKNGTRGRWFPSMIDWLDTMPGGIIDQRGQKIDPAGVLADFLALIHDTPNLDWLLLTKRPELWQSRLVSVQAWYEAYYARTMDLNIPASGWVDRWRKGGEPSNVWIGVSVEDQQRADERIPQLLQIPARIRFLSVEPLLGLVDLSKWSGYTIANENKLHASQSQQPAITWCIIGGESGPKARPSDVEWIRDVVRQCKSAGVPCFVKQLGANVRADPYGDHVFPLWAQDGTCRPLLKDRKGADPSEWPEELRVREFPRS
ncbi:MAG: DUF5131 family protein, partial [Nitrospira sp.]|nr:DUF5131 family protein [Nitrospira sp.]